MKIDVGEDRLLELREVYNGVVLVTPKGRYHICQRDGDIEVTTEQGIIFPEKTNVCGMCGGTIYAGHCICTEDTGEDTLP